MRNTSQDKTDPRKWALARFPWLWKFVEKVPSLRRFVNAQAINGAIAEIPPRPNPLSCGWDYTTWEGVTNRRWSGRHLPPSPPPPDLPLPERVAQTLFGRKNGVMIESEKSTLLFPYFAQWFTDGFLAADPIDRRRNYSNHEIDLSQLYGLRPETTDLIREHRNGRLRSQVLNGGEFPPFLFDKDVAPDALWDFKMEYRRKRQTYEDYADVGAQHMQVVLQAAHGSEHRPAEVNPYRKEPPLSFPAYSPDQPPHLAFNELRLTDSARMFHQWHRDWFAFANERANSTPAFVMMNVLMLREHNRIAALLSEEYRHDPKWNKSEEYFDERVFQTTRNILTVVVMKIVVEEYINHITPYHFKLFVDPPSFSKPAKWKWTNWMAVEFNMLYRWHSMIPSDLRLGNRVVPSLETLWNTKLIVDEGLAPMFNYASQQAAGRIGAKNTWDWLVKMAEAPTIQMGRDAEVASYNDYRELCGMPHVDAFNQISGDESIQAALQELYGTPERVEFYAGLFAEDLRPNSALAPLVGTMVGIDAFSQALTNPLLSPRIYQPETFSPLGWKMIQEAQSIEALVRRNTPEYKGTYDIHMTRSGWQPS